MCLTMAHFDIFGSLLFKIELKFSDCQSPIKKKKQTRISETVGEKENNDSINLGSNRFYTRKFSAARVRNHHQILIFSTSSKVNMKWEYM